MFRGPLTVLLARLGTVAALFMAQRLLFYWSNAASFPDPSLWAFLGGIRFDLSAIGWIFLPWVLVFLLNPFPTGWFERIQIGFFMLLAALSFFFNCVDIAYYNFTLRRSTADLLDIMGAGGDVYRLMPVFLRDYWYIALIFVASLWVAWRGYRWAGKLGQPSVKSPAHRLARRGHGDGGPDGSWRHTVDPAGRAACRQLRGTHPFSLGAQHTVHHHDQSG